MKIETLLFDMGKVLVDFNFELGLQHFASRCEIPAEELEAVIFDKQWIRRYERGEISSAEYHGYLCKAGRLRMELDEFHDSWSAIFMPDLIVPESLLAALSRRYPMIIVSNTNESHVRYIERTYRFFQYFTHRIYSHEVGALKPDPEIYRAAIVAAGKPPEALFFIDDREENVVAARRLGIHAHQFRSVPDLLDALRRHGIEFDDLSCSTSAAEHVPIA